MGHDLIRTRATIGKVPVARANVDRVSARSAIDAVASGVAVQAVVSGIPDDPVVAGATGYGVIADTGIDRVIMIAPRQIISPCRADNPVVTGATGDRIRSSGAVERVIARRRRAACSGNIDDIGRIRPRQRGKVPAGKKTGQGNAYVVTRGFIRVDLQQRIPANRRNGKAVVIKEGI